MLTGADSDVILVGASMRSLNASLAAELPSFAATGIDCVKIVITPAHAFEGVLTRTEVPVFDEKVFAPQRSPSGIRNYMIFEDPLATERVPEFVAIPMKNGVQMGAGAQPFRHRQVLAAERHLRARRVKADVREAGHEHRTT